MRPHLAPEIAEQMISEGDCDFVAIGKDALASHDWPHCVLNDKDRRVFNALVLAHFANIETTQAYFAHSANLKLF